MMKRLILAVIAVFIAWGAMDFVIHRLFSGPGSGQAKYGIWQGVLVNLPCRMAL